MSTDDERKKWLDSLKSGDVVAAVETRYLGAKSKPVIARTLTLKKRTPSGLLSFDDGKGETVLVHGANARYSYDAGRTRGCPRLPIEAITDELRTSTALYNAQVAAAEVAQQRRDQARAVVDSIRWWEMSTETLEAVAAIIEKGKAS
jgi:hypothetical protein